MKSARHAADRFDLGEGLLDAALVICSVTLQTSRRILWIAGIAAGAAGVGVALTSFQVHSELREVSLVPANFCATMIPGLTPSANVRRGLWRARPISEGDSK